MRVRLVWRAACHHTLPSQGRRLIVIVSSTLITRSNLVHTWGCGETGKRTEFFRRRYLAPPGPQDDDYHGLDERKLLQVRTLPSPPTTQTQKHKSEGTMSWVTWKTPNTPT